MLLQYRNNPSTITKPKLVLNRSWLPHSCCQIHWPANAWHTFSWFAFQIFPSWPLFFVPFTGHRFFTIKWSLPLPVDFLLDFSRDERQNNRRKQISEAPKVVLTARRAQRKNRSLRSRPAPGLLDCSWRTCQSPDLARRPCHVCVSSCFQQESPTDTHNHRSRDEAGSGHSRCL